MPLKSNFELVDRKYVIGVLLLFKIPVNLIEFKPEVRHYLPWNYDSFKFRVFGVLENISNKH